MIGNFVKKENFAKYKKKFRDILCKQNFINYPIRDWNLSTSNDLKGKDSSGEH
jgi:hypothetical protein